MLEFFHDGKALSENRAKLLEWAGKTAVGRARSDFKSAIDSCDRAAVTGYDPETGEGGFVICMSFGKGRVVIDADLNCFAAHPSTRTGLQSSLSRILAVPAGAVPANKYVEIAADVGFIVPSGLCLVLGSADKAKTPAAHLFAMMNRCHNEHDEDAYAVVRYGEPFAKYVFDEQQGSADFLTAMMTTSDIVVDSVKDVLAMSGGGAMASGLSRSALPLLGEWSALLSQIGATAYAPINPSTSSQEVHDMLFEAIRSNVASVAVPTPTGWAFSMRQGEGLQRTAISVETAFEENIMQLEGVLGKTRKKSPLSSELKTAVVSLTDEAFATLLRRSYKI